MVLIFSVGIVLCPWIFLQPIQYYLLPFVLGILFANYMIINIYYHPIRRWKILIRCIEGRALRIEKIMLILLLLAVMAIRNFVPYSQLFDTVTCVAIYLVYINIDWNKRFDKILGFLGKHSFNIFLFHTFIYAYYWPELIFWSRNPFMIFATLLCACLLVSVVIEYIKQKLGFYRLEQNAMNELSRLFVNS